MDKITNLPLGEKYWRLHQNLVAIEAKIKRPKINPSHRDALVAQQGIVRRAMIRTQCALSASMY